MQKTLARLLAEFAEQTNVVPGDVRRSGHLHIVDTIGVCIAGAAPGEESGQVARKLARKWHAEKGATVFGVGLRASGEMSALINGALAQALEMDDKHGSSLARPGSTVVPAALAIAEQEGHSLSDVITSVAIGYEVMIRLGFVAGPRFLERGYHTSSLLGAFGAAATIGRLRRRPASEIVSAFGIAGTMASGIQESTRTGSTSKILHGGWGAHSGIIAIDLAMAGITGPESVFEGAMGFFETHLTPIVGQLDWGRPAKDLGFKWHLPETAFKPYPCCQLLHAFIEACKQILVEMARDAVSVSQVTRISCKLAEPGLTLVTEPRDRKRAPQFQHEARFSLPFVVASALLHGDIGLESFSSQRLASPEIRRLAANVAAEEDTQSDYPLHCPARMEVEVDGKIYRRHIPFHPGSPEAALTTSEVLDKFARNSSWLFDQAHSFGARLLDVSEEIRVDAMIREIDANATHLFAKEPAV